MCTVLLPPGVNPIAGNKYIKSYDNNSGIFAEFVLFKKTVMADGKMYPAKKHASIFPAAFFFGGGGCVALRPNAGHGLLILDVSRSHTTTDHSR
jgi:hypothetical protein